MCKQVISIFISNHIYCKFIYILLFNFSLYVLYLYMESNHFIGNRRKLKIQKEFNFLKQHFFIASND